MFEIMESLFGAGSALILSEGVTLTAVVLGTVDMIYKLFY